MRIATLSPFASIARVKKSDIYRVSNYNSRTSSSTTSHPQNLAKKSDLLAHGLMAPKGIISPLMKSSTFWRVIYNHAKRSNSNCALSVIARLPSTLDSTHYVPIVTSFIKKHILPYNIATQYDIHTPPLKNNLNWHTHLLISAYPFLDNQQLSPQTLETLREFFPAISHMFNSGFLFKNIWTKHIQSYCNSINSHCITFSSQPGKLITTGPRYTQQAEKKAAQNTQTLYARTQNFDSSKTILETITKSKPLFNFEDIQQYLWPHAPTAPQQKAIIENLFADSDLISLGSTQHLGLFTTPESLNMIKKTRNILRQHKHTYSHIKGHEHTSPSLRRLQYQITKNQPPLNIPRANELPLPILHNILNTSNHMHNFTLSQKTATCSFFFPKSHKNLYPESQFIGSPDSQETIERAIHTYAQSKAQNLQANFIYRDPYTEEGFTQRVRSKLKDMQHLHPQDYFIATPQGALGLAKGDSITWQPHPLTRIAATVKSISPQSITITHKNYQHTLCTSKMHNIRYAYLHTSPPSKALNFSLFLPPLTPHIKTGCHIFTLDSLIKAPLSISTILQNVTHRQWSPTFKELSKDTLIEQWQSISQHLNQSERTLLSYFSKTIQESTLQNISLSMVYAYTHTLQKLWSHTQEPNISLLHSYGAACHTPSIPTALCLEEALYGIHPRISQNLVKQRMHSNSFIALLEKRHNTVLSDAQKHIARSVTQQAFCENPKVTSWNYYHQCHQQDWNFHQKAFGFANSLAPQLAHYTNLLQTQPSKIFNTTEEHGLSPLCIKPRDFSLDH